MAVQDKSNIKKSVTREYEDVMNMLREIVMYQYEQSPNATAFFRSQGVGTRVDPLQRLTELCTPDSLDHVCNILEAYRNMVFDVLRKGRARLHPDLMFMNTWSFIIVFITLQNHRVRHTSQMTI
jgi:hypothetical protein